MRTVLGLIILGSQGVITFLTLILIYMMFALMDYQSGIDSFIGTTLIQPILGGFISIVTMIICLFIGLPIRIAKPIQSWWTKNFWISITGLLIGLFLIMLSLLPSMGHTINATIENQNIQKRIPNMTIVTMGWFSTAFSLLHLFPPYNFKLWIEERWENT